MSDRFVKSLSSPLLHSPLLHALLIALVGLLAYANTFAVPFFYDDFSRMLDLPYVQDLGYLTDWSLAREHALEHSFRVRFVGYLTFGLNYALHGASVVGYHVVNLAIHVANSLLLYALVRLTPAWADETDAPFDLSLVALLASLLFVAHPVQTQAVTYIVQRLASLATLFCLGTMVCYAVARLKSEAAGWIRPARLWYLGSLACAVLAMKTKEIAFTLPLAVCLYEMIFFRAHWKRRACCLGPLLLTMLIIPLSVALVPGLEQEVSELTRVDSELTRYQYFATQMRVIVTYLRLLLLPVGQNLIYDYPEFHSLFAPQVFLSFLFLLTLFCCGTALAWRYAAARQPAGGAAWQQGRDLFELRLIAFGILWFFLTLSVESSFIPIIDVIFEHRLYLPSVGAMLVLAGCFSLAGKRVAEEKRMILLSAGGAVVLVLAAASFARNQVWGSQESLWQDVVDKSPGKADGHQLLGMALFQKGDLERALASFDRALAINPEFAEALCNRGNILAQSGRPDRALLDYQRAVEAAPDFVEAWNNMGLVHSQLGNQEQAIGCLSKALQLKPNYVKALNNMGLALIRKGAPATALGYLDRALALNAKYELAWFNRGVALKETGRQQEAIAALTRVLELNPGQGAAYTQRGDAWVRAGARDRALADFKAGCEAGDPNGCRSYQGAD